MSNGSGEKMSDPWKTPLSIHVCSHCGLDYRIFTTSENAQIGVELSRLRRVNAGLVETLTAMRQSIYEQPIGVWFHAIDAALRAATDPLTEEQEKERRDRLDKFWERIEDALWPTLKSCV